MFFDSTIGGGRRRLALSSSTAVLAMMIAGPAFAQAQQEGVESVTVSSSRIMSSGFDAPTPTTVISSDELLKQANTNVFTSLPSLPAVRPVSRSRIFTAGARSTAGLILIRRAG